MTAQDAWRKVFAMNSVTSLSNALALLTALAQSSQSQLAGQKSDLSKSEPATTAGSGSNFLYVGQISGNSVITTLVNAGLDQGGTSNPDAAWITNIASAIATNISMTSRQISDVFYSGKGINEGNGNTLSFQNWMSDLATSIQFQQESVSQLSAWLAGGRPNETEITFSSDALSNYSDSQVHGLINSLQSEVAQNSSTYKALNAAFASHSLTFQKATDVVGLDYSETLDISSNGNGMSGGYIESYNKEFVAQDDAGGKQHMLTNLGGVGLYLTW